MPWYRKLCLRATLVASNVLFFGGAIWLLVAGSRVRQAGWLDIFEDDYPWFHTCYVLLVIFFSLLIATLAISGLHSVLFRRKKWVIRIYAATTLLTLACCLFLSIEGGISLGTVEAWRSHATMDHVKEAHVQANFNQVYCVSQAAFLCTASSNSQWLVHYGSGDVRDLYLVPQVATKVKAAMAVERLAGARSLLELCEDETSSLHDQELDDSVANLCTWCGDIANLQSYVHLVAWTNTKCPPSRLSALFCIDTVWQNYSNPDSMTSSADAPVGVFVSDQPITQEPSSADLPGVAPAPLVRLPPYAMCRKTFLSYWSYLSLWFLLLSLMMLAFLLIVIRVAWIVLRGKPNRYTARHGRPPERTPLVQFAHRPATANAMTTTATLTNQPAATATAAKSSGAMTTAKNKVNALFSKGKISK